VWVMFGSVLCWLKVAVEFSMECAKAIDVPIGRD
jgi:hypothetical protein